MKHPIVSISARFLFMATLVGSSAVALFGQDWAKVVTEDVVRATLEHLASDAMGGRNSPSRGLETAATWIDERFKKAGLDRLDGLESYRHDYVLPGTRLTTEGVEIFLKGHEAPLVPEVDFRIWQGGVAEDADFVAAARLQADDARGKNFFAGRQSERTLFIETATTSVIWEEAAGPRDVLARRRGANGRGIFLVRPGLFPKDEEPVVRVRLPEPRPVDVRLSNIVGLLRGSKRPKEVVVISAHYDHIGVDLPRAGDSINNGADDDATGTTAVVELATALAALPRTERSLVFICFSAEEKGLLGSAAFAGSSILANERIVANINIEMLGRPDRDGQKKAWMTGQHYSDLAEFLRPVLESNGIELIEFPRGNGLFGASDNASFAAHGVVAHSISAGTLHGDYHQPTDEVAKIDIPHMSAVIRGIGAAVQFLGNSTFRPAFTDTGRKVVEQMGHRRR